MARVSRNSHSYPSPLRRTWTAEITPQASLDNSFIIFGAPGSQSPAAIVKELEDNGVSVRWLMPVPDYQPVDFVSFH